MKKLVTKALQRKLEKETREVLKTRSRPKLKKHANTDKGYIYDNPQYKVLNLNLTKLESMLVILTAEEGLSNYFYLNFRVEHCLG